MRKDEPGWAIAMLFILFAPMIIVPNIILFAGIAAALLVAEGIRRLRIRYTGRGYVDWDRCASRKVKKMREEENA